MTGLIPQDIIDQVRDRTDIADVVGGYVTLSRAGQNLKGLCPFHGEKTPSFNVSPSRQIFHCFGCGTGGNVFTFLMKIEGSSFPEAVRELARRAGMTVPEAPQASGPEHRQRERLEQVNEAAAAWFRANLQEAATGLHARAYLAERGIEPATTERFGLGLAPDGWDGVLRALTSAGFSAAELAAAGLIVAKDPSRRTVQDGRGHYDRFRSRLMFPIRDLRTRTIGFGGRMLGEGEPKYLNSPETALFSKGKSLYALERARESAGKLNRLVIVEGYFDAIALHQAGITNVAATLGTALTPEHVRIIRRFATSLVLLFDPDAAGVRAALRTLDVFVDSGLGVTVVSLPDGDDPDTFVRKQGADAFLVLQERAPSLLDFAVEHSLRKAVSGSLEDRIRSVDEILRILQKTGNRIEKEECTRRVAERLRINQQRLIERYPELVGKDTRPVRRPAPNPAESAPPRRNPEEWDLVYLLLQGKLSVPQIDALDPESFTVAACRRLASLARQHRDRDGRLLVRGLLDEALADEECAPTVTELSIAERHFDDVPVHIQGCLDTLQRKCHERLMSELIAKLRDAEREGRTEDARALNTEVNALRVQKAAVPSARAL